MTRTMYDSVNPSGIPSGATLVAGYVNGRYANIPAMRKRFPDATVVGISVTASYDGGTVLDVEQGDASPSEAPAWVQMRRKAGVDPTVYCNTSTWPAVREAFTKAGVAQPHYWLAHYGVAAEVPSGAVALQYKSTSEYDESVVTSYWPGVDQKKPVPSTKPKVSLKHVVYAAEHDPTAAQGHTSHPADVKPVESALLAEGLLKAAYAKDGSFGSLTVEAYAAWQRRCGYTGTAANGIPGKASLTKLGEKHGFTVVA